MKNKSISRKKKDSIPKNDKQKDFVYAMDNDIEFYIKNNCEKEVNKIFSKGDYLKKANDFFFLEGFNNIKVFGNKSKGISQVNIGQQRLSFSNISIKNDCIETVIHELAHGVSAFHFGYNRHDAHGEVFVHVLFYLLNKFLNISFNELTKLAHKNEVSYFYDFSLSSKVIKKEEYDKIENKFKNDFIQERDSVNKDFSCKSFLNNNKMNTLFKNTEGHYRISERDLTAFEEDLYINQFEQYTKKDLINLKIISPIVKIFPDGTISKNAKTIAYQYVGFDNINKGYNSYKTFQIKESAVVKRNEDLNDKKSGYYILKSKTIEQHFAFVEFFKEEILKRTK